VTLGLRLYALAAGAVSPLAPALLRRRAWAGKEDAARLGERLGHAGAARPDGGLVWLHAVSVGESLSLLPLVTRLRAKRGDLAVLVTSGTLTSARLLASRLPEGVIHQYAPVDTPGAVRRFLDHWRPALGVFVESELWPNLILGARRRGVRLALVSARITQESADGWRRARGAAAWLLKAFDLVLAQDSETRRRIEALGGSADGLLNLKDVAEPLPADEAELARMRALIGDRPVILAASTHAGEEALIASAASMMAWRDRRPLLIIAPRHPDRGPQIAANLASDRRVVARRSAGETIEGRTDVYVADTLGEMGLFYRLADVAVMAGSFLAGIGGHNPLEPARLGVGVVVGQSRYNFETLYGEMLGSGALEAWSEEDLTRILDDLIADPVRRRALGDAANAFAQGRTAQFEAAWARLAPMAPPP
jgi:3-deoxy-D-manno-octulosonic-acid transferase